MLFQGQQGTMGRVSHRQENHLKQNKDLEDNLLPLIDLEDDLPPLINFARVGELLEEVVRDQNSPNYHLLLEEALTNK
jgi:hypothetical protein